MKTAQPRSPVRTAHLGVRTGEPAGAAGGRIWYTCSVRANDSRRLPPLPSHRGPCRMAAPHRTAGVRSTPPARAGVLLACLVGLAAVRADEPAKSSPKAPPGDAGKAAK